MKTYDPKYQRFIFCLEGEWHSNDLEARSGVVPILNYLEQTFQIPYIHRKVGTKESLHYYLDEINRSKYSLNRILYFAFHGTEGALYPNNDDPVDLIHDLAKKHKDAFTGKLVHFGSCHTLDIPHKELQKFKKTTGAAAVSGYFGESDWLDGMLLEIALFVLCQEHKSYNKVRNELIDKYQALVERQEFELIV